jgi:hypothetical protein
MGDVLLLGMGDASLTKWETPFLLSPGNDPIPSTGEEFGGSPPEVVLSHDKLIGQRTSEALPPPLSSPLIAGDD